ncbi:MAG TPA: ribose-phosphate pyrophosphokinase [Clostridiales bacterium]|nr:ribose-phosphate pyrophosphokinase [Clostridiales bacterium]
MSGGNNIKLFAGNSNKPLAQEISRLLNVPLGDIVAGRFADGEINVTINETVRGCDCFIVQSTSTPVNDNLMELLVICDALKRASSGMVTAVMPYFGYARQDRKSKSRDPISAKLVANLMTVAGVDRVLTMDLHVPQVEGFFDIPVNHLFGNPIFAEYFKSININEHEYVAVSPDIGSVNRVRKFAQILNIPIAIIDKRRPEANQSEVLNIVGRVKNKKVIMIDDIVDTAGTLVNAATVMKEKGALEVRTCCTHAVLSGPAIERIENSCIDEMVVLDTICTDRVKDNPKFTVLSVADILAQAIDRIHKNTSISKLYTQK